MFKLLISICLFSFALVSTDVSHLIAYQGGQDGATAKPNWSVFLPDGEGRVEVTLSCSSCHDLRQVVAQKKTNSGWNQTVQKMVSAYQAPVDEQDVQVIVDYLSKNFGESNPIEQLPMNINTASTEALARLPGISAETASAIVESRMTSGPFALVEDLARVKGLDAATLEKIKPYIKTKD